jgi:hypothetical protein
MRFSTYEKRNKKSTNFPGRCKKDIKNAPKGNLFRAKTAHENLKENKLAEDYSTNRMIIRQVLNELAAGGLVSIEPYKGASVAAVSIDQIYETFNVEAML